jgi:hypothetical protein
LPTTFIDRPVVPSHDLEGNDLDLHVAEEFVQKALAEEESIRQLSKVTLKALKSGDKTLYKMLMKQQDSAPAEAPRGNQRKRARKFFNKKARRERRNTISEELRA